MPRNQPESRPASDFPTSADALHAATPARSMAALILDHDYFIRLTVPRCRRLLHDPDDPLLEPLVLAGQHSLGDAVDRAVVLPIETREVRPDALPRLAAEEIRE